METAPFLHSSKPATHIDASTSGSTAIRPERTIPGIATQNERIGDFALSDLCRWSSPARKGFIGTDRY
jgi:hypothetical protein